MEQIVEFISNHYVLAGLWMGLFVMLVYSYISGALSPVKEVSTRDATMLMNKEDAIVVDIRPQADFRKGHIIGAKNLKQEQINKAEFSTLEKNKDKPIIVVCAMGMSAKRTASQMLKAGFTKVSVLKGGMSTWQGENLPVIK
ncbi:rhodanese-like domain-containing protein [Aestuariibacter sp. AA17]|uniref:Rhodanese-like domain-containing protein n=1 Tax=Fluctibacter corallii TaxID=2984329 RepID=A0ABT3A6Y4_9ALTE|nr:rhodanese-like domain-containing protein [Aestuariibacter sp. AA17]MCV2884404.1 rhodanese-like domain-containing protein [Aestuariibacter sp. AA17]